MYVVQSSPTLLSVTGIEREYLLQQKEGGERHDVEPEDKSRVQCFSSGWGGGLAESMRKGFLETDAVLIEISCNTATGCCERWIDWIFNMLCFTVLQ